MHYEHVPKFLLDSEVKYLTHFLKYKIPWKNVVYRKKDRGQITTPRLTWCCGFHSNKMYGVNGIYPNRVPKELLPLKDLISNHLQNDFNYMLFAQYRDGNDSITYHSDDEDFLGRNPTIASLTLGATRPFILKNKRTKAAQTFNLSAGDLFVMKNNCQADYLHAVPKIKDFTSGPRFSITFRKAINSKASWNYYTYNIGRNIHATTKLMHNA
jgi:alkylated DNA repair dioxygenase AlkB